MRELKLIYAEGGNNYEMAIILAASMPCPLVGGALTLQGVVAIVDAAVTGIVR